MSLSIPRRRFYGPPRWHHKVVWLIARSLRRVFRIRVSGIEKLPRNGPAVVIAPHMSYGDSFPFIYAALPRPSRFIASAFFVLANAPVSWLMYFGGVLPLTKHVPDPQAARRALRVLAAGDVVALFPEGERAWAGISADPLVPSAKFLARLKVPIFIAQIEGSYDHWPRWVTFPRYRPVTVRLHGPIELPGVRGGRSRGQRRRWWDAVYQSGGDLDATAARAALGSMLQELSAGEASRLDLFRRGRFRQITRLVCFCPECARPGPVADDHRLHCTSCGAAWQRASNGGLKRQGYAGGGPTRPLSEIFVQMLETLRANVDSIVPIEEPVKVKPMSITNIAAADGRICMDARGAVIHSSEQSWVVELPMMAQAEIQGAAVVEVVASGGGALSIECDGGALRLVLAARALLDLPWGRGMTPEPTHANGRAVGA